MTDENQTHPQTLRQTQGRAKKEVTPNSYT